MEKGTYAIGVDIGGSHITAALVDLEKKIIIPESYHRNRVNPHGSPDEIIAAWVAVLKEIFSSYPLKETKIGIAMPGPFDYGNGISLMKGQDKYDALYQLNVGDLIAGKMRIKRSHIRFLNDAACFIQGEVVGGAAKGYHSVVGLTLGTGLGTCYFKNGIAVDADLWNIPFKSGIAEEYISTRWFTKTYLERTGKNAKDVKDLVGKINEDEVAKQLFSEFGENLALFLNIFMKRIDPELVVLGGNIANALPLFQRLLSKHILPEYANIPIVQAKLGEEAALLGASNLWG